MFFGMGKNQKFLIIPKIDAQTIGYHVFALANYFFIKNNG